MTDEEVLNLLADSKISVKPESKKEKYTLGQRAADTIAKFAGSWAFIFSFTGVLVLWMVVNVLLATKAFEVLSCVAAVQAPLIMMSQNRQEEKDRQRSENDYKVNLKTEIMIEDLYDKVNAILAKQSALEKQLRAESKKSEEKYSSDRDTLRVECKSAVFHADFLLLRPSRCCNSMGSAASRYASSGSSTLPMKL